MRFLCICQYGHPRSVAMCRELHRRNLQAVPVGWMTSPTAIVRLGRDRATHVIVMEASFVRYIPEDLQHLIVPVRFFDIGCDRWSNPYHPELARIVRERADAFFESTK